MFQVLILTIANPIVAIVEIFLVLGTIKVVIGHIEQIYCHFMKLHVMTHMIAKSSRNS